MALKTTYRGSAHEGPRLDRVRVAAQSAAERARREARAEGLDEGEVRCRGEEAWERVFGRCGLGESTVTR